MTTLDAIKTTPLSAAHEAMLAAALADSRGSRIWKARKEQQIRRAMALAQISPTGRFAIKAIDMKDDLHLLVHMGVPVPILPNPSAELQVIPAAILAMRYPESLLTQVQPGWAFVNILMPPCVWHPSVLPSQPNGQPLCLGHLPIGVPLTEIILLTYGALSMQTIQEDETDAEGVLNVEAARYWQRSIRRPPLTPTAFLQPD